MHYKLSVPQNSREKLILFLYGIFTYESILDSTLLSIGLLTRIVRWGVIILGVFLLLFNLIKRKIPYIRLLIYIAIIAFFSVASFTTNRTYLLAYAIFIMLGEDCDFDNIVRTSLVSSIAALLTIYFLCKIGILTDYIFYQKGNRNAHCFGFSYYSTVPFIVFYCSVMYMYLRKTGSHFWSNVLILAINVFMYYMTTLRLTFYLTFILVILDVLIKRNKRIVLNRKWLIKITQLLYPLGLFITIICMHFYDPSKPYWSFINLLTNSRLRQMRIAYNRYPISLLGNYIEMHGNNVLGTSFSYFYIDSGFAYSLLAYGIVFSILVIYLYSVVYKHSCVTNNASLFIWVTVVLIFTIVNNTWVTITYNPVLLISISALINTRKKVLQGK